MRRVAVTGLGAVSPFGFGADVLWESLLGMKNGIRTIEDLPLTGDLVKIAGCLPAPRAGLLGGETAFPPGQSPPRDPNVGTFFRAVQEGFTSAGLDPRQMPATDRVGTFIADRMMTEARFVHEYAPLLRQCCGGPGGSLDDLSFYRLAKERQVGSDYPFIDETSINHACARYYSITGPQLAISTACASGNSAIGEGFQRIRHGHLDVVIAGGAYNFDLSAMIGFSRLGALTSNPDPELACCPFDRRRSGFVMGAGCGVVVLEDLDLARKRGANILCEVTGYGCYSDAFRATDPDPLGHGAARTMKACLDMARLDPGAVSYINAHGTSTKMNDVTETRAIKTVFGSAAYHVPISSTKSMIGHSIMAAGAIEAIVCVKSLTDSVIHPTRNWCEPDDELDLDYVPDAPRPLKLRHALSNSFGFGGQNACLVFSQLEA